MTVKHGLLLMVLLAGCSTNRLESEWAVTLDGMADLPLLVVDALPSLDTVGISQEFSPYVLLSRPLTPTESVTLDLTDDLGVVVTATPRRDSDDLGVWLVPDVLERDRGFEGQVLVAGEVGRSLTFSTTSPMGPAYNMSAELEVEAFGAGDGQLGIVNGLFEPGVFPLWTLQLEGTPDPPDLLGPVDFVFAPSRLDPVSPRYVVHVEWGFVSVFRDVSFGVDGAFSQDRPALFLPLWSSEGVHLLRMTDVNLSGSASITGGAMRLDRLRLTGVLGTRSLLLLSNASEGWRTAIGGARPDVDMNGNGVPDSMTFTFSATPSAIVPGEVNY